MASTATRWITRIKRGVRWVWHGVGAWPVFAMACGYGFAWASYRRLPTAYELGGIGVGIGVWYTGWYAGRMSELIRVRREARAGRAEYGHTIVDAERLAMRQVWQEERFLAEQLYRPAKLLLVADPADVIAERFASSQLAAAVLFYEKVRAANDAMAAAYAAERKDTLT